MSPAYRARVIQYLLLRENGCSMEELRKMFPRAPLRSMEKEDGTIHYRDGKWYAIGKRYNSEGMRMTDCCGACSTYDEHGHLYCKKCYQTVGLGQGDGSEYKEI